jgi:RHS repeat-associated protein
MALDILSRQPTSQTVSPFTIMPFWDARGEAPLGMFSNGAQLLCNPPTSQTACVGVVWTWFFSAYDRQRLGVRDNWQGTLLEDKRDKSGLSYMRNRYYDPASGRFTQEDPSGLAGGLNQYGFAAGDPLNLGDPFGLCPPKNPDDYSDCEPGTPAWYAYRIQTGEGSALLNEVGGTLSSCNESWLCQGVLLVASLGSSAVESGLLRGTGKALVSAGGRIGATGEIGETALKALGGESQVFFRTSQGARFVDQLVNGVAHEAKVGRVALSAFVRGQIAKDAELLQTGAVREVVWHFFRSPQTGLGGPTGPLLDALRKAGIRVMFN